MRILRDHLLKEFFLSFSACIGVLLFIFLLGRGFLQMADLVLNKDVDALLVVKLLALTLPFILTFVIPMAVLVACLLTFGKLSFDNEIMAMRASGISLWRIAAPLFVLGITLCLSCYVLSDRIASESHFAYRRLLVRIGLESPAAALEEGTFIKKFRNFVIFIYQIDRNKLRGIRIYQPQEGKPTRTIVAQKGEIVTDPEHNVLLLKLIHGTTDEPDPKDPSKLYKLNFRTYDLPLNADTAGAETLGKKPKEMTVRELKDEIRRLGASGIQLTYPLSAEIHNKIALALASLVFLLVGMPLGITTRRADKSISYGIALILMTTYWLLLIGGKAVAQKGLVDPMIALQFSNFILAAFGVYLLSRLAKN